MSAVCIMIQGTMSNSGKTFVTAGLCRVFAQDGYKVAPFKSQNMALNSYITKDGLEIGRAQAMQAEAAGIEPTVEMNPILLKPTSMMGSQVIVNGEVYGNLSAGEYFKRKTTFIPDILKAYELLANQYDIIVIEGAGSPAEINLKSEDIVNMGFAKMVDAPVLLVADIDRGGVFASLYGTIELLEEEEKNRIQGMIINKFRGDKAILEPGLQMIEDLTHKKVVGVIPMEKIVLDDEDSLATSLSCKEALGGIDIAVIHLPHLSNFTDFVALGCYEGLSVRYVERKEELGTPDYIILPGTKNTMADLKWLRENGLEGAILRLQNQVKIFGICGGFQMLGQELRDDNGVEHGGIMRGLQLLPFTTVFEKTKMRTRVNGTLTKSVYDGFEAKDMIDIDQKVEGYEIHMGNTLYEEHAVPFCILKDGRIDGCINEKGTVMGTYLHGIFDNESFVRNYFQLKGDMPEQSFLEFKESQYDKLADLIRNSLNMEEIYHIMGLAK